MILVNTVPNYKSVAPKLQKLQSRKVSITVAHRTTNDNERRRTNERHQPGKNYSLVEMKFRRDKKAFCILYKQRVRPHLDYGISACPPSSVVDAKLLERVQSKATALVDGMRGLNAEERRKRLGLMTLEEQRERGDMIEVFKMLKGLTRIDPSEFWEVRDARGPALMNLNLNLFDFR